MASSSFSIQNGHKTGNTLQPSHPLRLPRRIGRRVLRTRSIFGGGKDGDVPAEDGKSKNPFANFSEILNNAKEAQARAGLEASNVQEELSRTLFEGYDAEEKVKVIVSGNQEPKGVEISDDALTDGAEALSAMLLEAQKDAHQQSVQAMKARMLKMYADLGIPIPPQNIQ